MNTWIREYEEIETDQYLKLFDRVMRKENDTNVEFLEKSIEEVVGRKAVACNSGTDALHFSLISLGIGKGDEVLTTNFSWISTASVISMVGATPVFCDIDLLTYHMSFDSIQKMYSPKVKAIIYPHLFGNMSDISKIKTFCQEKNIHFIEDACQSLGSSYNGAVAGSEGNISTLSFNDNKVVSGISGGGAILTDGDTEIFKRLRKHGDHKILGYNSKMLLFNAEIINFRLKKLNEYISKRQSNARYYDEHLKDVVIVQSETMQQWEKVNHNYHKYVVRFKTKEVRDLVKNKLNAKVHYNKPISENKMYDNIEHRKDDTTITKMVCDTILTLPLSPYMKKEELDKVINTILILV